VRWFHAAWLLCRRAIYKHRKEHRLYLWGVRMSVGHAKLQLPQHLGGAPVSQGKYNVGHERPQLQWCLDDDPTMMMGRVSVVHVKLLLLRCWGVGGHENRAKSQLQWRSVVGLVPMRGDNIHGRSQLPLY
jgi:hypothetical protein